MTVRRPPEKLQWILRIESTNGLRDDISKFVVLDTVPDVEQERAPRPQYAADLSIRGNAIWEEHDGELAHDHVKDRLRIRECHHIGLPPHHRSGRSDFPAIRDHGFVQVGRDDVAIL